MAQKRDPSADPYLTPVPYSLIDKIPKVPHWRWVLFVGESHPDWGEPFAQLSRHLDDFQADLNISDLRRPEEHVVRAMQIHTNEPPIRKIIESMLYEHVGVKIICDALFHKFKEMFEPIVIYAYRHFFYDTKNFNSFEITRYYEQARRKLPEALPVPGNLKEAYVAYINGAEYELDMGEAAKHMFATSFFRAQELKQYGWVGDSKVIAFQKNALDILKTLSDGQSAAEMPKSFDIIVHYPEHTALKQSDANIGDYDPDDDPNELNESEKHDDR